MNCKNCGAGLAPNSSFCTNCGTSAVQAPPPPQQAPPTAPGFGPPPPQGFGAPPQHPHGFGPPPAGGFGPPPPAGQFGPPPPHGFGPPPPPYPHMHQPVRKQESNCLPIAALIFGLLGGWLGLVLGAVSLLKGLQGKTRHMENWLTFVVCGIIAIVISTIWIIIIIVFWNDMFAMSTAARLILG